METDQGRKCTFFQSKDLFIGENLRRRELVHLLLLCIIIWGFLITRPGLTCKHPVLQKSRARWQRTSWRYEKIHREQVPWAFTGLGMASQLTAEKTHLSRSHSARVLETKDLGLWGLKISETFEIFPCELLASPCLLFCSDYK